MRTYNMSDFVCKWTYRNPPAPLPAFVGYIRIRDSEALQSSTPEHEKGSTLSVSIVLE